MPAAIDTQVKKQVIKQYLSGDSRDRIAANNDIGAGTVTNIINEWKKGVEYSDYDSLRELTVPLKKKEIGLNELAPFVRHYIYLKKLGADADQIESFIANCMNGENSLPPEKIIDLQINYLTYRNLNLSLRPKCRAVSNKNWKKSKG